MSEISIAEVDQAEAELRAAKEAAQKRGGPKTLATLKEVKQRVATLRQSYRAQEEAAGRRTGLVSTEEGA